MTFELLNLKQLIDLAIHEDPDPSQIKEHLEESETEKARILMSIENALVETGPEKGKQYLNQHQKSLIFLLNDLENELTALSSEPAIDPTRKDILISYQSTIDNILIALENQFPHYFDFDCKLPVTRARTFSNQLKQQLNDLQIILKNNKVSGEVTEMFSTITQELINSSSDHNYQQTTYLHSLIKLMQQEFSSYNQDSSVLDLIILLISADLNHPCFYHFCCGYIAGEIEQCDHLSQQYRILNYLKKTVEQIFKVISIPYSTSFSKIDAALLRYINAEIAYLQSVDVMAGDLTLTGQMPKTYQVTFTVRQLAIFMHLQVEVGIVIGESPKSIRRYITSTYSTVDRTQISEKSFKNAYYSHSGNDIKKVMEKLAAMLALAKERY